MNTYDTTKNDNNQVKRQQQSPQNAEAKKNTPPKAGQTSRREINTTTDVCKKGRDGRDANLDKKA
eukprot:CAMPEP_0197567842 /NCGR_PEP_ID=MMETSP1320-20131121/36288_1 /TAXON_ID=91990 /ORGANISM="Bolidomonas sp., Strain RCC2347" /LENGTH=64 /DNA_ID=CAMNT_0043130077 /DNA_START=147 /DNA_END=338 /DNA_ORIENTATION=-